MVDLVNSPFKSLMLRSSRCSRAFRVPYSSPYASQRDSYLVKMCSPPSRSGNFSLFFFNNAHPHPNLQSRYISNPRARVVQSVLFTKCGIGIPQNGAVGADLDENAFCPRDGPLGLAAPLEISNIDVDTEIMK